MENEPAESVDERRHAEVERDEDPDRGGEPDARRRDRDREDDQHRERTARPEPQRLADDVAEATEALSGDEQEREPDHYGDDTGEGERGKHTHASAQFAHHRGLNSAGEASGHSQGNGQSSHRGGSYTLTPSRRRAGEWFGR